MTDDAPAVGGSPATEEPYEGADWDTGARIVRLLEVVQRFAVLDFSEVALVGGAGDDLDALAAGINMLGEELEGWNQDFHQRVTQQTSELNESLRRLQRFNDRIRQLSEMSNLLQGAVDHDEAWSVLGRFAPEVLSDGSGAVYTATHARTGVDERSRWGPHQEWFPPTIPADACGALLRRRTHRWPDQDARCDHFPATVSGPTLCVPLSAQGVVLGLLSTHDDASPSPTRPSSDHAETRASGSTHERLALAATEQFALAMTNLGLREELRIQSIRDALTGLYNRRHLDDALTRELSRANRTRTPVSVLMLDIDHFKTLNDTFGHTAGDAVLTDLATVLLQCVRGEDTLCRYGGEEFAVIMAGLDQAEAIERAEQLRSGIARHDFAWNGQPLDRLTASVGVATSPQHGGTADQLLNAADTALYRAKDGGRNRVESATDEVRTD